MKQDRTTTIRRLTRALEELRKEAHILAYQQRELLTGIPHTHQESAQNLLHYLAIRQHDIRHLQQDLSELGLSRLGRIEPHALSSIDAVLNALHALDGAPQSGSGSSLPDMKHSRALLVKHAASLFGPTHDPFPTRIMVTMPSEAATDPQLVYDLLAAGMKVMRINCAHDGLDAWLAMIEHLRQAEKELGQSCKVYADLTGPKLRTGRIKPLGRLVELKIKRDAFGREISPALVWLTPFSTPEAPSEPVNAVLPIEDVLLSQVQTHDTLEVDDTRGSIRQLIVLDRIGNSCLAVCHQHAFIDDQARCRLYRDENQIAEGSPGELPEIFLPIVLKQGDRLQLVRSDRLGDLASYDDTRSCLSPARIPCSLDVVFSAVKKDQPIWFDDGKIGGIITAVQPDQIEVLITRAAPNGSKLRPEKGINLPDTCLPVQALTESDIQHLDALAGHIDIIGLSFVRDANDVKELHGRMKAAHANHLDCILKIETRQGFENLPYILLAGMQHPQLGIMIARGDLAVEVGFERLSEVQEEIICLCEAAHIPAIWATQVLESMARSGTPSRAEVSDAAHSIRTECVMLNKGPHIVQTVEFLHDILLRMSGHRDKQRPSMRRLAVSRMVETA